MLGAVINKIRVNRALKGGLKLGEGTRIIAPVNFGSEPYLVSIGKHVTVSSNVHFITHDGGIRAIQQWERYAQVKRFGKIVVKDNVFIGLGSIILPGVTIGENVVVAARSVVAKDVPDNCVVAGSPAQVICSIEEYAEKALKKSLPCDPVKYKEDKRKEILRCLELEGNGQK